MEEQSYLQHELLFYIQLLSDFLMLLAIPMLEDRVYVLISMIVSPVFRVFQPNSVPP
jgi:hypothetical protein